jgi:hypothetical protein
MRRRGVSGAMQEMSVHRRFVGLQIDREPSSMLPFLAPEPSASGEVHGMIQVTVVTS